MMKSFALGSALALSTCGAHAQSAPQAAIPISIRFAALQASSPPGSCGCFWLKGAAIDAAIPLLPHVSAAIEVAGVTTDRVPATSRGLSTITLLAGPRYTLPLHRVSVFTQFLAGAVRGFDADFQTGTTHADTSTAFAFALAGALDVPVTPRFAVRAAQVEYLQSNLPNGVDNRQRNVRLGAGIVYRLTLPPSR